MVRLMDPDDVKRAWQGQASHPRLSIDAELLLKEVRRNERSFDAIIFWRDVREVGMSLVMVPFWIYLGVRLSLPWTWYLTVPALLWVAGYMLTDRRRHNRRPPEPGDPLRRRVESSLAEVEHQIRLLRSVFWWYLLPLALPMLAFFGQVTWRTRAGGLWAALVGLSGVLALVVVIFAGVYWLNQYAVRAELEPRRQKLEALLASLADETPDAG
jgi:hypothetical protein